LSRREQRLVFGEVAEDYAAARPSYPDAVFDDVCAGASRALEVGAGTGKATAGVVARGVSVLALEPSAEMAAVGRREAAGAEFVVSGFEDFACEERFELIYAAQAWHWVDASRGYVRARELLADGGRLALFWNRTPLPDDALRRDMDAVYQRVAPRLAYDAQAPEVDYREPLRAAGFDAELREYPWSEELSTAEWVQRLGTFSDHRMRSEAERSELLSGVADVIDRHGGTIALPHVTRLYLARAR
jgi:SAM-dependent methyltransferase